ncbi:MAG: helix-turn-helix domain-containing protein [Deltaproteobacteria bacterium]|nr:helix-turn-helix domain-containing protein [Deltaproteobacteria bacterium]
MAVIAVGGAKGGVGRSVVAAGIAVYLAQLGRKVLVVDGHPYAPQLARAFGCAVESRERAPWQSLGTDPRGIESAVPNVRVLQTYSEHATVAGATLRRPREIAAISGADHVVLDLGAGSQPAVLDAMLDVDAQVLVTLAEPAAVEAVYRWIRHAYARALHHALKAFPVATATLRQVIETQLGAPAPLLLARAIEQADSAAASVVRHELAMLSPWLVVNASRSRVDLDLGESMRILAKQQLGVELTFLGHVEFDESVSLTARRRRPLMVEAPGAKSSRNLERLARRLVAGISANELVPAVGTAAVESVLDATQTHYDTLVLDRGATDDEVRRAVRRMRELYSPDSLPASGLASLDTLAMALAKIEEARDVLLDPIRRRPYDLSLLAPTMPSTGGGLPVVEPAEPESLPDMPELSPVTEFDGALLRAVRMARGLELRELASRTKIPRASLEALEDEAYDVLPPVVYLRGFLSEFARQLRLDPEQVALTYLRRMRDARSGR